MMKKILFFVVALTNLAFFALNASGQSATTGSIAGTVTDPSGAAVPGVMVTATSPNLIRAQSATSGGDGRYSILNLPPGKYTISVDAQKGFAKLEQKNVGVNLGSTSPGDIRVKVGRGEAEVSVTAGPPLTVTQTTTGNNVSFEEFSNFPTQRSVQGLYTIAPSVARSGLRDST